MVGLGILFAGAPSAQTTTKVDVRNFEVISVDGNKLVVRDERGANELTVPDDFRFTVDGKKMSVSELKPGMKGTATVTTTTTIKPVFVTEVKEAVVLKAGPGSMVIRDTQGVTKRFTQDELDERGMLIMKDGRVIRIGQLREGDVLTTTMIVSKAEPVVVTEKDVQATTLAQAKAEPKAESATMQAATKADAPQTAPAPPSASPPPSTVQPPPPPSEASGLGMTWYVLIALLIVAVLFFVARRRKAQ